MVTTGATCSHFSKSEIMVYELSLNDVNTLNSYPIISNSHITFLLILCLTGHHTRGNWLSYDNVEKNVHFLGCTVNVYTCTYCTPQDICTFSRFVVFSCGLIPERFTHIPMGNGMYSTRDVQHLMRRPWIIWVSKSEKILTSPEKLVEVLWYLISRQSQVKPCEKVSSHQPENV